MDSTDGDDGTPSSPQFIGHEILSVTSPARKYDRRRRNTRRGRGRLLTTGGGADSQDDSIPSASNLCEVIDHSLRMALEINSLHECLDVPGVMTFDNGEERAMREAHRRDLLKDDMMLFYRELVKVQTSSSSLPLEEGDHCEGLHDDYVSNDRKKISFWKPRLDFRKRAHDDHVVIGVHPIEPKALSTEALLHLQQEV